MQQIRFPYEIQYFEQEICTCAYALQNQNTLKEITSQTDLYLICLQKHTFLKTK